MAAPREAYSDAWSPLELLDRTRAVANPQTAWAIFNAELSNAGFERIFYAFGVPATTKQPFHEALHRGYFQGSCRIVEDLFSESVKRPELLATDRVAQHCRRFLTPYEWSCAELQAHEKTMFSFAREFFGVSAILVLPLHNVDQSLYGSFTAYCTESRYEAWMQRTKRLSPLLHITAQYLQDQLYTEGMASVNLPGVTLSPRQRECLLWASRGLSSKRIADRLGLSQPVVHEYLGAARRKLGCANTAHAVARAINLDLIDP